MIKLNFISNEDLTNGTSPFEKLPFLLLCDYGYITCDLPVYCVSVVALYVNLSSARIAFI